MEGTWTYALMFAVAPAYSQEVARPES